MASSICVKFFWLSFCCYLSFCYYECGIVLNWVPNWFGTVPCSIMFKETIIKYIFIDFFKLPLPYHESARGHCNSSILHSDWDTGMLVNYQIKFEYIQLIWLIYPWRRNATNVNANTNVMPSPWLGPPQHHHQQQHPGCPQHQHPQM